MRSKFKGSIPPKFFLMLNATIYGCDDALFPVETFPRGNIISIS